MPLIVYTAQITSRIQYAWEVILRHVLQVEYELCDDPEVYRSANGCKINYSNQRREAHEVFIPAGNLLFASDVRPQPISCFSWRGHTAFFQSDTPDADVPFDLPAAVFYLVSRYEEYLPFEPDQHGRFPAKASLAYREGFLQNSIINDWILEFCSVIIERFPQFSFEKSSYYFQPTYDIDLAWAYRHKGFARTIGAGLRHLLRGELDNLRHQLRTLFGEQTDPFDQYDYLENLHQKFNLHPIYFFLVGDYGIFDKNINPKNAALHQLIRRLHQSNPIGIHPSYRSHLQPARVAQEKQRLEQITGSAVGHSRHHFLLLRFPDTYRALLSAGITQDHTMGYADAIGFRAGIATPFPWYDLEREQPTALMIHPFQVMDVTLRLYLQYDPEMAIREVSELIERIKAVGGTFSTIWHNSSLSHLEGWQDWRRVYEAILKIATDK